MTKQSDLTLGNSANTYDNVPTAEYNAAIKAIHDSVEPWEADDFTQDQINEYADQCERDALADPVSISIHDADFPKDIS
jgi:hypothetical protein